MKKLLTFFLTALLAFGVGWADEVTYTFNSVSWGASPENWSGTANANQYSSTQNPIGVQVTTGKQGMTVTSPTSYNNISKIVVTYTSTSKGVGSIKVSVGNNEIGTQSIAKSQSQKDLTYSVDNLSGSVSFVPYCTTNSYSINSVTITYTSGGTPSTATDYSLVTGGSVNTWDDYVLVYTSGSNNYAFSKTLSSGTNTQTTTGFTLANNVVSVTSDAEINILSLESAGNGLYYIKGSDGYYWGCGSSTSLARATDHNSADSYKWQITVNSSGEATIYNNNASDPRYLRYRSYVGGFKAYASSQSDAYNAKLYSHAGVMPTVEAPTFSPNGGTFTGSTDVTISSNTTGVTIYYTLDGTDPAVNRTTNSIANGGTVTLTESCTLKAMASLNGVNSSISTSQLFTINQAPSGGAIYRKVTNTNDLTSGDYLIVYGDGSLAFNGSLSSLDATGNSVAVTISNDEIVTSDAIYFTYDATAGTLKSASGYYIGRTASSNGFNSDQTTPYKNIITISSGNAIITGCDLNGDATTAKLQYFLSGANSRFRYYASNQKSIQLYKKTSVATPVFSPQEGTYTSAQNVTISCSTDGATIYYTTDGSTPTSSSTEYTGAIPVNSTTTIKAIAVKTGLPDSEVATAIYTIDLTPTLTASPNPLTFGTIAGGTLEVTKTNISGDVNASVLNANYNNVNTDKWTVSPSTLSASGTMTVNYSGRKLKSDNTVRLSANGVSNVDVPVHYQHAGPVYIVYSSSNWDFTTGDEMTYSNGEYTKTINSSTDTYLVFTKKVGNDVGWSDGKDNSPLFGPVANGDWWLTEESVDTDFAIDSTAYHVVKMHNGTYTIKLNPATNQMRIVADVHSPVISLASGTYQGDQTVTITCDTYGAHIYYTTDGSDPSDSNNAYRMQYSGAITISETTTLRAVAVYGNITSQEASATYVITAPFQQKNYEMVTNISDLVANQTYLIVYKTADDATTAQVMGPIGSNNYASKVETTDNNRIIISTNEMAVVTLLGSTGNWTLATGEGILAAPGSKALNVGNTPHTWTISKVDNKNTFKIRSNTYDTWYLQYNASSPRFACYEGTQQYVYIYRESTTPAIVANPTTVSIELAVGEAQNSNTFTVGGRNLTEGVTLALSAEDQANGFSLSTYSVGKDQALAGVPVVVTYSGPDASATATITLSSAGATSVYVTVNAIRLSPVAPTITPATSRIGDSDLSVSITAGAGAIGIVYVIDNGTEVTVNTTTATVTIPGGNDHTLTAYSLYVNNLRSEAATGTYTYRAPAQGEIYRLTTEVTTPDTYVLVYSHTNGVDYAMSADMGQTGDSNYHDYYLTETQNFTIEGNDAVLEDGHNVNVLTITDAGSGRYYIQDSEGYYLGLDENGNYVYAFEGHSSNNQKWTITFDSNNNALISPVSYSSRSLKCNPSTNPARYLCYSSSSSGVYNAKLYKHLAVSQPVISPSTGEYTTSQRVEITCETSGAVIYYTLDGSDPSDENGTLYNGPFTVESLSNGQTTVKAIAYSGTNVSTIASETYTWIAPQVTIRPATRDVYNNTLTVVIGCNPVDATIYYTTDGTTPSAQNGTLYEGPFEVTFSTLGDQVTVKAIAYNNANIGSTVDVATYTYTTKVIDVAAPFFSPIEGGHTTGNTTFDGIYYGEQTLMIECTTPNAYIYYEIEEVSGTTPPSSASVSTPTNASTPYDGAYTLEVGKSYRVKAIAYIGDFASQISEGYYIIKSTSEWTNHTDATTVLENVAQLRTTTSDSRVTFRNPIQVVYMSSMANDPTPGNYSHPAPEYVYVRDNSGYGVIYFGKGAYMWATQTNGRTNSPATIFEMGDWIDGSWICGTTGTWTDGLIPQVGTGDHTIFSWPEGKLGNTKILAEEYTCSEVRSKDTPSDNLCGHYIHLRNTTLDGVDDYSSSDLRHNGTINDASGACTYYDRFWLYSGTVDDNLTFTYKTSGTNVTLEYTMSGLGHYGQAWFDDKGPNATFDVFCVADYYAQIANPSEVYPLDFLWIYKPVITPATNLNCTTQQVVDITVDSPDWGDGPITPTIYYKTDDMEDWEEFIGPFIVNSDTHVQAYAEVPTEKFNDIVRSDVVSTEYQFTNIKDPIITDDVADNVILVQTGNEEVNVTIQTNPLSPDATTLYTTNGEVPTLDNGTVVTNGEITLDPITETTTVTAISYIEVDDGQGGTTFLWSNPVTETYTFVKSNGIVYDLVHAVETGKIYVIVNKDANMGMSTTQNATNRASTGVMFTDNTKEHVYGNDELALFVLESANAGRYYFKNINGGGYLTVTTNDYANLNTSAATSTYSQAAVSFGTQAAGYPATIMFNYDGINRYLRYFEKGRTFTTNADVTLNKDVFLYGVQATPLAYIESEITAGENVQVTVADDLIGAWAVNGNGKKYLWAKDMGYSINPTNPVKSQTDYVKDIMGWQDGDWDQSNWVIIDFGNSGDPDYYVGKKLTGGTITGKYVEGKNNGKNYRIVLESEITAVADNDAAKYPGYMGVVDGEDPYGDPYENAAYNTYLTANFLTSNTNVGNNTGFVATEGAHAGDHLFFMNPKLMEVALVYGVWAGDDLFTVYVPNYGEDGVTTSTAVNAWGLKGAVKANWAYNRLTSEGTEWGKPGGLDDHVNDAYFFHAVITPKANANSLRASQGIADGTNESGDYEIYPLNMSDSGNVTAVRNVNGDKAVVSVRYYNIMGMESEQPFEGINIVVTRYSDGSTSTIKVLK